MEAKDTEIVQTKSNIRINIDIKGEDLVTVAVAQQEKELRELRATKEEERRTLSSEITKISHKQQQILKVAAKELKKKEIENLVEAFAGLHMDTTISYSNVEIDKPNPDGKEKLEVQVNILHKHKHTHALCTLYITGKPPNEYLKLRKEGKDLELKLEAVTKELDTIRRGLNDLVSVERQAKAAIVREALSGSEEGRKLLSRVNVNNLPRLK